jgi:hypothetical protein
MHTDWVQARNSASLLHCDDDDDDDDRQSAGFLQLPTIASDVAVAACTVL